MESRYAGDTNLVNVAQDDFLDCIMLQDFADDATIAASHDEHLLWVRVAREREVSNHFLVPVTLQVNNCNLIVTKNFVRELIAFGALYGTIKNQDVTVCLGLEDKDVLVG